MNTQKDLLAGLKTKLAPLRLTSKQIDSLFYWSLLCAFTSTFMTWVGTLVDSVPAIYLVVNPLVFTIGSLLVLVVVLQAWNDKVVATGGIDFSDDGEEAWELDTAGYYTDVCAWGVDKAMGPRSVLVKR